MSLLQPRSPEYDAAWRPPIPLLEHRRPEAIARCHTAADVAEALAHARRHGLAVAARSGGHCFGGRSSTDGLLVDVGPMNAVTVGDGVATIGAGARLGDVYDALGAQGVAIAGGCGPTVGIAGLTLGGGLGILGRTYGLTCDQVLAVEVVLADGRVLEVSDGELFWALRGAGGGRFGIVTRFELRTVPAPATTTLHLRWPFEQAPAAIAAWQDFTAGAPDALAASLLVTAEVHLFGAMLGTEAQTRELVRDFVDRLGAEPASERLAHMGYRAAKRHLAEHGPGEEGDERVHLSKSEFFRGPLGADAISALVEHARDPRATLDISPWGGAYNRVAPDATAFPHRAERFLIKHDFAVGPGDAGAAREWLARSWEIAHPYGTGGAYVNFPDADLDEWDPAYHGANRDRLLRAKAEYDPDEVLGPYPHR
jgi:FAD/FMN-containing dehydrogenase